MPLKLVLSASLGSYFQVLTPVLHLKKIPVNCASGFSPNCHPKSDSKRRTSRHGDRIIGIIHVNLRAWCIIYTLATEWFRVKTTIEKSPINISLLSKRSLSYGSEKDRFNLRYITGQEDSMPKWWIRGKRWERTQSNCKVLLLLGKLFIVDQH